MQEATMKLKLVAGTFALLVLTCASYDCSAQSSATAIQNPVLYLIGQESYLSNGTNFIRYRYGVANSASYPDAMFAAAPSLPPCGTNTKSSRTWVDMYDQNAKRLYGFCALGTSDKLNSIWFALPEGQVPPSWIYIELTDRQTGTKYKSNLADTTN
jgi:hypothetical protein